MSSVLLISGTRKGIGKALAEYYLDKGWIVVGCSRKEATVTHPNYTHYCLNVAEEKKVVGMVREVKKKFERIDVLINNAGAASMNHMVTTPARTLDKLFSTNFSGTFLLAREAGKVMMKQKYGRIVNFSSVAAPLYLEGESVYAACKAAVENFTRVAAKELAGFGITVNAVGPTPVPTDLIKHIPEDKMNRLLEKQAVKRMGEIRDITNVIDFFISEKSDFITGQIIYLGGVS